MKRCFIPFIILLLTGISIWSYFAKQKKAKMLSNNYALVEGTIEDFRRHVKPGRISIHYDYTIDNRIYHGSKTYPLLRTYKSIIVKQKFPVAYDRGNIENSELILTGKDVDKYQLKLSDNYKWVEEL